ERVEERRVAADEREVRWALDATARLRVEHRRGQQTEQEQRGRIRDGDGACSKRRAQPARRVRKRRLPEERGAGDEDDEPDRESERMAEAGVVQLRQEPGEAGGREQRPKPVASVAAPEDEPDRDERPARAELGDRPERRRACERAGRITP